jgi:hypothetical protein
MPTAFSKYGGVRMFYPYVMPTALLTASKVARKIKITVINEQRCKATIPWNDISVENNDIKNDTIKSRRDNISVETTEQRKATIP